MSQNQKLANLRQQLERWKSHNEVHAKPADEILYEFLSELLKLGEYEEPSQSESIQKEDTIIADESHTVNEGDETDEDGGNNPEPPDVP